MASFRKMLGWFRSPSSAQPEEAANVPEDPVPEEPVPEESVPEEPAADDQPAFDLFPEEAERERSADRRQVNVTGSLVLGAFTNPDPVVLRDLSPSGLYFFCSYKLLPGQLIEVTLTDPDTQEKVCYHANVVRTEPNGENRFGVAARITRREILSK